MSYLVGNPEDRFFITLIDLCNKLLFFTPVKNDIFQFDLYCQQGEAAPESMKFKCANHLRDVKAFFHVSTILY